MSDMVKAVFTILLSTKSTAYSKLVYLKYNYPLTAL